ncbi:MAG: hypothetical protein KC713_06105 [Candidatus Omnitrophica bacterium]|nr:hypothetical protein [Candidatus Omnitrophota bacterium]
MIDQRKWEKLSFYEQQGNIASEIRRAIFFKKKNNIQHLKASLLRLVELLKLIIVDTKNQKRLKEPCRFKEVVGEWFAESKSYTINHESLKNYCLNFALLARK